MSGTHRERSIVYRHEKWVPAFAGMTVFLAGMTVFLAGMTVFLAGMTVFLAGIVTVFLAGIVTVFGILFVCKAMY